MRIFTKQALKQYIKGNTYRVVVVIKLTIKFVYIRFIGTHKEYPFQNLHKVAESA